MPSQVHEMLLLLFRNRPKLAASLLNEALLRCPVCLLVVAASDSVARWAAKGVDMGGGNRFVPLVLTRSAVPKVTNEDYARAQPELAVLSAMSHGRDEDSDLVMRIAYVAQTAIAGLDEDQSRLYFDLILNSVNDSARKALQAMDSKTFRYQSEFTRRHESKVRYQGVKVGMRAGVAEGRRIGRAETIIDLLGSRFGALDAQTQARVNSPSMAQLEQLAERLLNASTLQEALAAL